MYKNVLFTPLFGGVLSSGCDFLDNVVLTIFKRSVCLADAIFHGEARGSYRYHFTVFQHYKRINS